MHLGCHTSEFRKHVPTIHPVRTLLFSLGAKNPVLIKLSGERHKSATGDAVACESAAARPPATSLPANARVVGQTVRLHVWELLVISCNYGCGVAGLDRLSNVHSNGRLLEAYNYQSGIANNNNNNSHV